MQRRLEGGLLPGHRQLHRKLERLDGAGGHARSYIPAVFLVVVLLVVVALVLVVLARRKQRKDEWEIDSNELEMGETLGTGGYGEVFRAKWRGTEVAVKMMAARDNLTKDMQRTLPKRYPSHSLKYLFDELID